MVNINELQKSIVKDRKRNNLYSLFMLAVLTTCFVSGTMARYATVNDITDDATVAKWGVTITPSGTIFEEQYAKTEATSFANTVISDDNTLAPGTSHSISDLVIEGTPEVAVRVDYSADITLTDWEIPDGVGGTEEYCPVIFTVEGTDYKIDGTTITSIADLITEVEGAISDCSTEYPANMAIDNSGSAPTVSWRWEIGGDLDATNVINIKDTALGDKAANGTEPFVEVAITALVTQID